MLIPSADSYISAIPRAPLTGGKRTAANQTFAGRGDGVMSPQRDAVRHDLNEVTPFPPPPPPPPPAGQAWTALCPAGHGGE